MIEFGTYLRNAREHAGLSLQDLHERTRISVKNLRLIESGDFPSIPQTYVRAFVREYARVVGLDEHDSLARYNDEAERERGIPRPPDAIDSSNLLPKADDSVEFLLPSDLPPSHVEVVGTAEVEDDGFVVPVRKSTYVREGDAEAIDIRTAAPKAERSPERPASATASAAEPPSSKDKGGTPSPPAGDETAASETVGPERHATSAAQGPTDASAAAAAPPSPHSGSPSPPPTAPERAPSPGSGDRTPAADAPSRAVASDSPKAVSSMPADSISKPEKRQAPPPPAASRKKDAPAARQEKQAPAPQPARQEQPASAPIPVLPVQRDAASEKRIIGVGMVVIALLAIVIYGLVYFGSGDADETAAIDSTSIKASIEAGRFIDSSQYALTDIGLSAEDTAAAEPAIPPEPVEARPREFAKEDSLILEAFTSAPVWISVKMDTLRTERSSLLSNEHRIWKAKDYFVITLGDAGAVTFFLNGKEIGTLGDEGSVVKNITLSRQQLNGN